MLDIRLLAPTDISAAMRLSNQAGWNQLPADWLRLMDLWPTGCLGGWVKDELVGTATLAGYGTELGWIGMILVDQACRGQGVGTRMFRAVLEQVEIRGLRYVGLDATESGRSLYLKQGFYDHGTIDRWSGAAAEIKATLDGPNLEPIRARRGELPAAVLKLDYEAVGTDRSLLLMRLHRESDTFCRTIPDGDDALAAGFARRGRLSWAIGPVLARSKAAAVVVLHALLCDIALQDSAACVCIDVPRRSPLLTALRERGFTVQRHLWRMARPLCDGPLMDGVLVVAAAGFELG
jgi:GNAT superfamily N-acetyltransferase